MMLVIWAAQKYKPILAPKQMPAGAHLINISFVIFFREIQTRPIKEKSIHDLQKAMAVPWTSDDATMTGAIATNAYPNVQAIKPLRTT